MNDGNAQTNAGRSFSCSRSERLLNWAGGVGSMAVLVLIDFSTIDGRSVAWSSNANGDLGACTSFCCHRVSELGGLSAVAISGLTNEATSAIM